MNAVVSGLLEQNLYSMSQNLTVKYKSRTCLECSTGKGSKQWVITAVQQAGEGYWMRNNSIEYYRP